MGFNEDKDCASFEAERQIDDEEGCFRNPRDNHLTPVKLFGCEESPVKPPIPPIIVTGGILPITFSLLELFYLDQNILVAL